MDEETAADAVELIEIDFEPLPFVIDPLDSLRPGGPDARSEGNVWGAAAPRPRPDSRRAPAIQRLKWSEADFAEAAEGRMPMGQATEEWAFGDLDAGFKSADLVLDETFVVQSTGHHPLETRSAMAYWQNGKLYLHCSTQSVVRTRRQRRALGGHRAVATSCSSASIAAAALAARAAARCRWPFPALLSKKANAPVMMRISREEESYFGRARTSMTGRVKIGFRKDGRITALDLFIVQDNGPYGPMGDHRSAGNAASLIWQPAAMRWRAVNVLTNTPPRTQQRSPGPMQANGIIEPVMTKAAQRARPRSGGDPADQLARRQGAFTARLARTGSAGTSPARS